MEKNNTAKAAGLIWIVLLFFIVMPGVTATVQAETLIIPNGDYSITENAVYQLSEGYTGIITIEAGVTEATVSDALNKAHHDNTGIFIDDGRTEALLLTIEDIDIAAGAGRSGIDFRNAGMYDNKLFISGTCNIAGGDAPGIHVPSGAALTIDKKLDDENDRMTASGVGYNVGSGIGGRLEESCGVITINGGTITANSEGYGTGIGGGSASTITINGGTITANGGAGLAGIGSDGGDVTINGGTVFAYGSKIYDSPGSGIEGSIITITGGTVTASGKGALPGIGGNHNTEINISGGIVYATTVETYKYGGAAGIGGGTSSRAGISITISGGVVSANGGYFSRPGAGGAGIGSGAGGGGATITISGGEITANAGSGGGAGGAGIGSGALGEGATIIISGGEITANAFIGGLYGGAGIGGGGHHAYNANSRGCGNITITGNPVINATGDTANGAENIGKGRNGSDTGTLKDGSGTDLSYLKFSTSEVPGANIKINGSEYTANDQGISGIFVPRIGSFNYTVSKAGYEAVRGNQEATLMSHQISIPMVTDNTASVINDVTPLLLRKGTSPEVTFNNDYGIYGALYLVPKAGSDYIAKDVLDGATDVRTAAVNSPDTSASIDTTGLAQGIYQLYLVDSAENVSAPSADIIADYLPEISDGTKDADDAYVDLVFSEGIYGAADGISKLTKDKLQLVFAPHGSTSVNAEIISVKQNDGTQEAAASELQGGEDVVRVFIEVSGLTSGAETIEIKPANGSSIYDIAGNAMSESQTTGVMHLKDCQAPIVGTNNIRISNTTRTGTTLTWNKANDMGTAQAELEYCIYQSEEDNINSVADIKANGTVIQDYTSDIGTLHITGLRPGSTYCFNVIVRDNAGNIACYNSASAYTQEASSGSNSRKDAGTATQTNEITIPISVFTGDAGRTTEIKTELATVVLPSNMLTEKETENVTSVTLTIGKADISKLSSEVQEQIGSRPVIELTLKLDGRAISWNNPDATVNVSIPYTPTAAELANPKGIVIWYIDASGNAVCVPNGRYDPATGTVTFSTTHFSSYGVSFNNVSFDDVAAGAWYYKPVSFIAARGITTDIDKGNFNPDAKLTRGQFIVMLMKAYGINPDTELANNFSDAGNTYYTGYLAAAKRLGISAGVGNNLFAPGKEITRQEMFTLLYNVLHVIGQLPQGNSDKTLSDFTDAGEISPWAKESMRVLVETGVIEGYAGKLNPHLTITKAEMAQVLYSILSK